MSPDIINSIVAIGVYWLTKLAEKRNAATIVVMDIRHAEQVVLFILGKGMVDNIDRKYPFREQLRKIQTPLRI